MLKRGRVFENVCLQKLYKKLYEKVYKSFIKASWLYKDIMKAL